MKVKLFLYLLLLCQIAYSGTTGKIAGVVLDASTNEPLPGANVILEETTLGAATNLKGQYTILNVPPGVYTLRASMIGYQETRVENVNVSIDLTTEINFSLPETVLEMGESVTIVAERPMVVKDLTASTAIVGAEDMESLPVTEVNDAIELQAGLIKDAGGGLHVRGGRSGEISYWVDGIPITDVYDGGTVVDINKNMVQELQVITGAFNAEYGQAMSGIVNIATKSGSNKFGGNISAYLGDHISNHDKTFMYIDNINPVAIRNIEGSLHGSIVKDKLFYYANARAVHFDGWLYGQRRFNPHALTSSVTLDEEWIRQYAPEYLENAKFMENGGVGFQYVHGSNPHVDSLSMPFIFDPATIADPDSFARYYDLLTSANADGRGDQEYVPMNGNTKLYGQLKLIYNFTPSFKLSYSAIYDNVEYSDFERDYVYNPDGALNRFRTGFTNFFRLTHILSDKTFYKLGVATFQKTYKHHVYEDKHDPRYVHPDLGIQQAYSFKTAGTDLAHFKRQTNTMLAKLDLTSQITNTHQIKTGIEFRRHQVEQEDISLRPAESDQRIDPFTEGTFIDTRILPQSSIYYSSYNHQPIEFSAYIQDKMEFRKMIVNVGLRMDYFEPDGVILSDPSDPTIYNPIRPENRYYDYGTDGLPDTHDSDGTENNNIWDEGEPPVTLADRQKYWYQDATSKFAVSPRLGVSFPITERGVFHFSYGHFFQIPRFERLYQNPDFEMESGTGNVGVIGNADLEPEQTVSGEIGLQQQISDDITIGVTGYFRDIRNLAGTRAEEIELFGGAAKYSKFVNSDFGLVKGLVLSVNKRFSGGLSASFDYTLQQAKGSNSDPEQARNALEGGSLPEVQLTPLDWDQKHTINGTVSYNGPTWGVSLIGQWGSGLPYTPRRSEDITTLLTNSQRKPITYNLDLRAYKEIKFGPGGLTLFLRIQNLFDAMNEINVYDTTGRAGFTLDQQIAEATNPIEIINSLDQWFSNPSHYSEPRRVEAGFSYTF